MLLNPSKLVLSCALFSLVAAVTPAQTDQQAYCSYVIEQGEAQRDQLRTPVGTVGLTQPETGLPVQVVAGASLGLSSLRKAGLTMEAARKNCELYKTTTQAQQTIQYAIPSLEKEALQNRLSLIDRASKSLDDLMQKTSSMIKEQNATAPMLFSLQTTKIKLDADRADTQSKITALYTPSLSDQPLKALVAQKQRNDEDEQKVLDDISRQNNWDIALSVGVHQQVTPVAYGAQPYGAVTVSYNFASRAIDRHLDSSEQAYGDWKKEQESDVVRSMEVLHQQLLDTVSAQEARLKSLQEEGSQLDKTLQSVVNPDTSAAFDFHNQLTAAQLLLQIEEGDASFRIDQLQKYLAKNY